MRRASTTPKGKARTGQYFAYLFSPSLYFLSRMELCHCTFVGRNGLQTMPMTPSLFLRP